ncbi:class I adenylate-forming enzyme family protein [Streptomyces sp. NPDC047000]|uniref:class I adenylate-forming enzyme family protein n=1 Tax=Streptomyces sp. NPDC047000 TaxID=3155474 RepID=UPI0033FE33D1
MPAPALEPITPIPDAWVDRTLLAGPHDQPCLHLGTPLDRGTLRTLVDERRTQLAHAGLGPGGTLALHLPPSVAYVTTLLAAWQCGAQVALLDYRLTAREVARAHERLAPQLSVEPTNAPEGALRGFFDTDAHVRTHDDGRPAASSHALIQLSSGSTGPSKIIGRSAENVTTELRRYAVLDGFPRSGERVVVTASPLHVLGLVGGLLYSLHAGVEMVVPARLTVDGILRAVALRDAPTTLLGVPFHAEVLAGVDQPRALPGLRRMITGGEPVRPSVWEAFTKRYQVPLGSMYGMTEAGVIATDLDGRHRPAHRPVPGLGVRVDDGEILLGLPESPYAGDVAPGRWADGWLRTHDAGTFDPATGLLQVHGRLDSQVSVGGLKVDLTEVEETLTGLPGVAEAVVVHDTAIAAYLTVDPPTPAAELEKQLADRLAAYKRPRSLRVLPALPRTATGKLLRDPAALRRWAADAEDR